MMLTSNPLLPGAAYEGTPYTLEWETPAQALSEANDETPPSANFQFNDGNRWSSTATDGGGLGQGDATTITWSLVPDGTEIGDSSFDDNGGGAGPSDLIDFLDGIRGDGGGGADLTIRPWFQVFVDAFDRLSELSGITYVYEASDDGVDLNSAGGSLGVRGDVRIGGRFVDGQPMGGSTLAYNAGPNDSDMVLDTGNVNFYSGTANNSLSFRNTLMHEAGHGIGISHVLPVDQTKLMEPTITTNFDGPQIDDILAMHRGYGDVLEKNGGNDSTGTATNLGTLSPGTMLTLGADAGPDVVIDPADTDFLSIDDDGDTDVFEFQLVAGAGLKVMLTPLGPSYDQGPQGDDDNPPPDPTNFNTSAQNDLTLEILDSGGAVVATANAAGLGGAEVIDFDAGGGGTFFVRVTGADNAAQLYQLDMISSDRFEENDSIATATILGSIPSITLNDLSIHNETDEDYFKITAHDTGKLIINAYFEDAVGDIDIRVRDSAGNEIEASTGVTDNEQIVIPVVSQEMYFLHVTGFGDGVMNTYDLEIENFAAPAPAFVDLATSSDTGMMNDDNITADDTPTFLIQADLADFLDMGIDLLNANEIDPNSDGDAADADTDGAGVYVSLINLATGVLVDGFANQVGPTGILWSFTVPALAALADGEYFVSSAVQIVDGQQDPDRENGRAQLSDPLIITIDDGGIPPNSVSADMLTASDTGMLNDDNVTNKMQPAFHGIAPVNTKVRIFANGELVGATVAGTDGSDVNTGPIGGIGGADDDGLGLWEITVEPLADNGYDITLEIEEASGNIVVVDPMFNGPDQPIDIVVDTEAPNTPLLDLIDDEGRNDVDNITNDNTPTVTMTSSDPNIDLAQLLYHDNLKFRIYDRFEHFEEFLLYDSALNSGLVNEAFETSDPADAFTSLTLITQLLPEQFFANPVPNTNNAVIDLGGTGALNEGVHNLKLEVEDRAGNFSHDFLLQIEVDTAAPPVSFGLPGVVGDGLLDLDDSGNTINPGTFTDLVTHRATPRLWGQAEADSIVRVYADTNGNGMIEPGVDVFLGQDTAIPLDGNQAEPDGYWEIDVIVDLDDPAFFAQPGGLRNLLVSAEDVPGNVNNPADGMPGDADQQLDIFIDRQGPQVNAVTLPDDPATAVDESNYDLFDPKPSVNGPTPLVRTINIDFVDFPDRVAPDFVYGALENDIAQNVGNYSVVGDHVGHIAIESVAITASSVADGSPSSATVSITFAEPLPDDRYTLTVSDNLVDPAGNRLDGESNADEPQDDPLFASGDGVPGGDFVSRFTIDTRPEIGSWVAKDIDLDINGNFVWDPDNQQIGNDATNVDISFTLPTADPMTGANSVGGFNVHDLLFAGKFAPLEGLIVGNDAVFILDVSGSTSDGFGGDPVGDQNNDGVFDTILDAEIAAFKALNQELIDRGLGNTAQVSIIAFGNGANSLDMDLMQAGFQQTTAPLADTDGNGVLDVEEILMDLSSGGGTNYEAALAEAANVVNAIAAPNTNVIFLSDGAPNSAGAHADEAAVLQGLDTNLRAFGVGPAVPLAELLIIDPAADTFADTNQLLDVFAGGGMMAAGNASGFDQLAAYGNSAEGIPDNPFVPMFRWIIDTNSDGVVNTGEGDIITEQPLQAGFDVKSAIPVAGDFDQNPANGDEIGLYNQGVWVFDTDRDFVIETGGDDTVVTGTLFGQPVVGDFDGDGLDDLASFNNNQWYFDLANDGLGATNTGPFGADAAGGDRDQALVWGFPGVLDKPVAADMDQDGIDDIGLWVPRTSAQPPRPESEWYFLLSSDPQREERVPGTIVTINHAFEPVPFGDDLYAEFGDERAMPIVGNFDPPVTDQSSTPLPSPSVVTPDPDTNGDGSVDGFDFLAWQRGKGMAAPDDEPGRSDGDANRDGSVDGEDLASWQANYGQQQSAPVAAAASQSETLTVISSGLISDAALSSDWQSATMEAPTRRAAAVPRAELIDQAVSAMLRERVSFEQSEDVAVEESVLLENNDRVFADYASSNRFEARPSREIGVRLRARFEDPATEILELDEEQLGRVFS